MLNPKPALFFLTFLPQFVDRDQAVAEAPALEKALPGRPRSMEDGGLLPCGPAGPSIPFCAWW